MKLICSPRTYRSSIGLDFWYDFDRNAIVTNDPQTSIQFIFASRGLDGANMFVFLRIGGTSVQIARKNGEPYPASIYRGPKYSTTWVIGSLGLPLCFDAATKVYFSGKKALPRDVHRLEPVATDRGFSSKAQQNKAMTFLKEALQRYDGHWLGACRGQEQQAAVCIRPELEDQLASAELLNR